MAEAFREGGYTTLMVGKWHLCKDSDLAEGGDKHSWPLQRGFDQYYGFLEALTNFHQPHRIYDGNRVVDVDQYPDDYYLTDDLTDHAIHMLRRAKADRPDKPVFLYFAHGAVHAPLHARRPDIERQRDRYAQGWDRLREERLARQRALGVVPADTELPPRNFEQGEHVPAWDSLSADEQNVFARYMEIYAAMVESIDESTGRLRATFDELGELDNTIFVFLSDNGASREGRIYGTSQYFRDSGTGAADGTPVSDHDLANLDALGGPTTWPHYPRGWAMACNTPFRLYKITTFRGGHQVPCIISWPARYGSAGGQFRHQYAHVTDLLPTLAELTGIAVPTERHGLAADPLAGQSFAPLFDDTTLPSLHPEQYTECIGNRSYYRDGWEAVTFHPPMTPFREDRWQLFHVATDVNQRHDIADDHPDVVKELVDAWEEAAWANQVFPLDDGTRLIHLQRPPQDYFSRPVTLVPGTPTLERYRSAQLIGSRSFQIVVDVDYHVGDRGVLVAHGGQESGYVLYIEDGQLNFEFNAYGKMRSLAVPLEQTCRSVVLDVTAQPKRTWDIELLVDNRREAGDDGYIQWSGFLPYEGIDVGIDRRSPVSWSLYERHGAFPYQGSLKTVRYVPGDFASDAGEVRIEQARALGLKFD
jgi:arylsulfatase